MNKTPVKIKSGTQWLQTDHIVRFEADGSHTRIFLADKTRITSTCILKHYHDRLHAKGFYRIHDKHLVNKKHIIEIGKGKNTITTLSCKTKLPVSCRKKPGFTRYMNA